MASSSHEDPDANVGALPKAKRATVACTACRKRQVRCQKAPTGSDCLRCQKMNLKCEYIPLNVQRGWEGQQREQDESTRNSYPPSFAHQLGLDPSSPSGAPTRSTMTQHVHPGESPRSSRSASSHAAELVGPAEVATRYEYPASHVGSGGQWAAPTAPSSRPAVGPHGLSPTISAPMPQQWAGVSDPQRRYIPTLPPPGALVQPDPRLAYPRSYGSSPETVTLPRLQTNMAPDYRRTYTPAPASAQPTASQWPARSATPGAPSSHGHGRSHPSWAHQQQTQWSPDTSSPTSASTPSSYYTQQQSPLWQQYDPASTSGPGQPGSHPSMYADPRGSAPDQWSNMDVNARVWSDQARPTSPQQTHHRRP